MQILGHGLPPAYVFESLRAIVTHQALEAKTLVWGAGLAGFYILLACWVFARVYRYAVRTGLFARYSAESVS
jgi:ABC-2 type transport system permease protein